MLDKAITTLRPASPFDAEDMAKLINLAGEGLPLHFWGQLAEKGQDLWHVGAERARRDEGGFSWRNGTILEDRGAVAALLITYAISPEPEAIDYAEIPPVFVPLQELENLALDTVYVNVLATYAPYRKRGYGRQLLQHAEQQAHQAGKRLSIIVSDGNPNALRLYESFGFKHVAERPIVSSDGWSPDGCNWVLMIK